MHRYRERERARKRDDQASAEHDVCFQGDNILVFRNLIFYVNKIKIIQQ